MWRAVSNGQELKAIVMYYLFSWFFGNFKMWKEKQIVWIEFLLEDKYIVKLILGKSTSWFGILLTLNSWNCLLQG